METPGNGLGNTSTNPHDSKRIVPGKKWCFTAFEEDMETLEIKFKNSKDIKFICGKEKCPSTGKKHIQGYIECDSKIRPIEKFGTKKTHWEKAKGDQKSNLDYCSKEGEFSTNFKLKKKLKDPMDGLTMKPWQTYVLNIIAQEPDNRKIYWFWESIGGVGKSSFTKHLVMNYNAIKLNGKAGDMCYAIKEWTEEKDVDIVICDIPRDQGNNISYIGLEDIKTGCIFSSKFESGQCLLNPPHMIIFANVPPKINGFSDNKVEIIRIEEEGQVQVHPESLVANAPRGGTPTFPPPLEALDE